MPPGDKAVAKKMKPLCKDCKSITRALIYPGPRCASCWRVEKARRAKVAHGSHVEKTYGITEEKYWELYEYQGGRCAICRRAMGKTKRLAVDHDHKTNEVRGLLCGPCNNVLGTIARDDPEVFDRAAEYLRNPPARAFFEDLSLVAEEEDACQDQQVITSS